ncbi:hypothetical protein LQ327_33235 [Actinomycetospora endophytica]|uniref:Uncharacterized protein n=1 Tax=Actinomycetospora endophytica TaxID=2291215 RepID=A0ABS8PIZ4_9PSEU|nr:hypothetical protein [Actinomycetospora endophytica]MCD2198240.1 hypothetical protein [Actinomycetospora endophytica]
MSVQTASDHRRGVPGGGDVCGGSCRHARPRAGGGVAGERLWAWWCSWWR